MDYRKVAIISSIAVLVLGGGVVGVIAWRASQLAAPEVVAPGVDGPETPANGGGLTPIPGGGTTEPGTTPGGTAGEPPGAQSETTVAENPPNAICDAGIDDFDCDYDNLTNAEERALGTDPRKEDTDGDGLTDGSEVHTWKSNPLNPRSIDPSMTDLEAVNAGKRTTR